MLWFHSCMKIQVRDSKNMGYNIILDELPESFGGVKIKTDFRQVLRFFRLQQDNEISDEEKAEIILRLFFHGIPKNCDIMEFLGWYINAGEEIDDESSERVFDFEVDSGRIFSAFFQAYKIDLTNEKMHWFIFHQLLSALPDNTRLMQVIDIRGKKPGKYDDKEYARQIRKLQRLYAIEKNETEKTTLFDYFKAKG